MRILRLELLNLASLDNPEGETIDFEHGTLGHATIFSIVGPTGSGKSTLLDAICLALYNRAPRYPRRKGDRNSGFEIYGSPDEGEANRLAPTDCRNILTRGRKRGYSKLTFRANNGMTYRAEWHVAFRVKKYDRIQTSLYLIEKRDGIVLETPQEWERLNEIIGLDYDQFLRTVLIAQGSFAGFLTAREEERCELLEKLIGETDRYRRIAEAIRDRRRQAHEALQKIDASLNTYATYDLTPGQLSELDAEIERLTQWDTTVRQRLQVVSAALEWYVAAERLSEVADNQRKSLDQATEEMENSRADMERLSLFEATSDGLEICRRMALRDLEARRLEQETSQLNKAIESDTRRLEQDSLRIDRLKKQVAESQAILKKRLPILNQARLTVREIENTKRQLRLKDEEELRLATIYQEKTQAEQENRINLEKEQAETGKLETAAEKFVKTAAKAISLSEERVNNVSGMLGSVRKALEDFDTDMMQQNMETRQINMRVLDTLLTTLDDIDREEKNLHDTLVCLKNTEAEISSLNRRISEMHIEEKQQELETLRDLHTLMISEKWEAQRHRLEDGEPCPLCGATHHPFAEGGRLEPYIGKINGLYNVRKKAYDALAVLHKELTDTLHSRQGYLTGLRQKSVEISSFLNGRRLKAEEIRRGHPEWECGSIQLACMAETYRNEEASDRERMKEYMTLREKCDEYERMHTEALREHETQRVSVERQRTELADARHIHQQHIAELSAMSGPLAQAVAESRDNLAASRQEKAALTVTLETLKTKLESETGGKLPDEIQTELEKNVETASGKLCDSEAAMSAAREELGKLAGRLESVSEMYNRNRMEKLSDTEKLAEWLESYNSCHKEHLDTEVLLRMSEERCDWDRLRELRERLMENVTAARANLESSLNALKKHNDSRPTEERGTLNEELIRLQAYDSAPLIEARGRRERYEEARRKMGEILDERRKALETEADWAALGDSAGSDGKTLRRIAQCYTLGFLIDRANDEIRRFNNRYELRQVSNSLGIRVIDHDRGDDVRDTTSLSGGETFIVSLGLALGLSSLSSRNISFDNLFIDEGFGTLDPDTLSTVIDSLAMLQSSQGKKVGVISHTDTMSERISTRISIIKNGRSGSSRIEIYP